MNMQNILIGGAWPYANGPLHIGHIAALLPGDVLARYFRAKGERVCYVSGSDCHGTPVAIRARQEARTPLEVSDRYHTEFRDVFGKLGFSFDRYGKTSSEEHKRFARNFHQTMYESGLIEQREAPQAVCPHCGGLTDRFVTGACPLCGEAARGDQCDCCGAVLEAEQLRDAHCAQCGAAIEFRQSRQLYLALTKLLPELTALLERHPNWRNNAIAFTRRYLNEGLRDRAITRDLDWGISVPKAGYNHKKIYIWAENVLGYLSMSEAVCREKGADFRALWGPGARHYYVHGKDNIPFHTVILPALLLAYEDAGGGALHLPDEIISSEYMTLEGRRISTSKNWAVWAKDLLSRAQPDAIRYFFLANGPERRDADFSQREFAERTNGELVGAYGNLINRTLAFLQKYRNGTVPDAQDDPQVRGRIAACFPLVGGLIEKGRFKDALAACMELARFGNQYFDAGKPWVTRTEDPDTCEKTLWNCIQLIGNLAVLLQPFLPFSSDTVISWPGASKRLAPAGSAERRGAAGDAAAVSADGLARCKTGPAGITAGRAFPKCFSALFPFTPAHPLPPPQALRSPIRQTMQDPLPAPPHP